MALSVYLGGSGMAPSLPDLFAEHLLHLSKAITDDTVAATVGQPSPPPYEAIYAGVEDGMRRIHRDLTEGATEQYSSVWEPLGAQLASAGMSLESVTRLIDRTEEIIIEHLAPSYSDDVTMTAQLHGRINEICRAARATMFTAFTATREATIRAQSAALQELSAPIIPIYGGVLVLPLIGTIDTQRAAAIMETLLEGVAARNARVVLLDITGVPVVDTSVAHHLIQAARAVRLLGAEIVLVGIRPEIAQTIVQLGVDLSGIATMADLQGGVAYALERLDLAIVTRPRAALPMPAGR
jgi:rsbT co-antagonist protein RsbR